MGERKGTKALEIWCKRMTSDYPSVNIENMTTSWRNGLAFCAMIHHFRPDLIDFQSLKPEDVYYNNELAFRTAEKYLGIPALLDPEDMVDNSVPDRLSILTYLSQFYQRFSVSTGSPLKKSDSISDKSLTSPEVNSAQNTPNINEKLQTPIRTSHEPCTACGLPVYLAQRLLVARHLYHRRCFCCVHCGTQLNPSNCYENLTATEFSCDACLSDISRTSQQSMKNDDMVGMLNFSVEPDSPNLSESFTSPEPAPVPVPAVRRILPSRSLQNLLQSRIKAEPQIEPAPRMATKELDEKPEIKLPLRPKNANSISSRINAFEKRASDMNKINFLVRQLGVDDIDGPKVTENGESSQIKEAVSEPDLCTDRNESRGGTDTVACSNVVENETKEESDGFGEVSLTDKSAEEKEVTKTDSENEDVASQTVENKMESEPEPEKHSSEPTASNSYPEDLCPFSEDEDEEDSKGPKVKKESTNPFGSSDEEDEYEPSTSATLGSMKNNAMTSITSGGRRLIPVVAAPNPFWSDGEEPMSDDEQDSRWDKSLDTSKASSSLSPLKPMSTPKKTPRKKAAPQPPSLLTPDSKTYDDTHSLSSTTSSQYSNAQTTPRSHRKKPAPPRPPNFRLSTNGDSFSVIAHPVEQRSEQIDSFEYIDSSFEDKSKEVPSVEVEKDTKETKIIESGGTWRRHKGPAPGLPLPGRKRLVAPPPAALRLQLALLEQQQRGLERQGVRLERLIRRRCEGGEGGQGASPAPSPPSPGEVDDLVLQLCEIVNEKNELFRKQAELMHVRRQQRLEQEQADVEHEIRLLQSRPHANRTDADKAREERLVSRLVTLVSLRDELVQRLEEDRRRERAEDEAIAASIAEHRAKRAEFRKSTGQLTEVGKKDTVKNTVKKHLLKKVTKKNQNSPKQVTATSPLKDGEKSVKEKGEKKKWF